ncbi:MAG: hypothetical protein LBU80_01285, partial [Rikenellaceae bacterium]|nr:hypothetical protein [Rikenellaceae bacterium]
MRNYFMKASINSRFVRLISELYRGNKRAFAQAIDVYSTVIENVVGTRQGKPSYDVIEKICANANVSPEWLLTGNGPMLRTDEPPSPRERDNSRELEMCQALLREKEALNLEQAKEIGRLEERISHFQTSNRQQPSYGGDVPFVDLDAARNVSRVR